MKKTLILAAFAAAAAISLGGCASLRMTPEEKAAMEAAVQDNLDNRTYVIDVDQMIPRRGISKHVTNYSLASTEDNQISHRHQISQATKLPDG